MCVKDYTRKLYKLKKAQREFQKESESKICNGGCAKKDMNVLCDCVRDHFRVFV